MNTRRSAFTLLETVIGLFIICSLVTISSWNLKGYQAQVEEKQSIEWFKNTFKNTMNSCFLTKKVGGLKIDKNKNQLMFSVPRPDGTHKVLKKTFPQNLEIISKKNDFDISNNGQISPLTIKFESKLTKKIYAYKIQMGWGEIIETST